MRSPNVPRATRIEALIRSACRRRFLVLAVDQLPLLLSVVLAGAILILLLGTRILDLAWLCVATLAGLAIATLRIRAHAPTRYGTAQIVDRRLNLSDTLSTAWFLLSHPGNPNESAARVQLEQAERLTSSVKLSAALPFPRNRTWIVAGALAAVALSLFALRYLITSSLNLEQALVPIHLIDAFAYPQSPLAETHESSTPRAFNARRTNLPQSAASAYGETQTPRVPNPDDNSANGQISRQEVSGSSRAQANDAPGNTHAGDRPGSSRVGETPTNSAGQQNGSNGARQQMDTGQQAASHQNAPSLINKMTDALSSLMAKMRQDSASRERSQNHESSRDGQNGQDQMASSRDQNGNLRQNSHNDQAEEQQTSAGEAQGESSQKAQSSRGLSSDRSADVKKSDARSGAGRQDGDKALKEAEQMQALGKLAEIIGKRSATVTGDVTLETPSGKQQLKTQYSKQIGRHSDLGGEINRDEIPLIYQQYVREYMEQVRKQQPKSDQ